MPRGAGLKSKGFPGKSPSPSALSNLQAVLSGLAPAVPGSEAYLLSQLWESLEEASAYGQQVSMQDSSRYSYVPFLSGLQLFEAHSGHLDTLLSYMSDEDSPTEAESSACSTASCSSLSQEESEGSILPPTSQLRRTCKALGPHLIFEHFASESPFQRQPLTDAVHELAETACPQLLTLSSADLHPYSWLSIVWYPLYRTPAGCSLRTLDASFLTYHSLQPSASSAQPSVSSAHTPLAQLRLQKLKPGQVSGPVAPVLSPAAEAVLEQRSRQASQPLSFLRPFGFVPCKASGGVWRDRQNQHVHASMVAAALAWAQAMGINSSDATYFASRLSNSPWAQAS